MLLIFASAITNRLRYITDLLISKMLGVKVEITRYTDEFNKYNGPKISYSDKPLLDGLFIEAKQLLFDVNIVQQAVRITDLDDVPIFFHVDHPKAVLPFDPFAAAFFMVSRYEEYLPYQKDRYGRFPAEESLAWQGGFLEIPVVHLWAEMIGRALLRHYPGLTLKHREYRFMPTIDVDHAYAYRGRTLKRTLGGIGRDMLHGQFADIFLRFRVLTGLAADPYDNYSYILKVHEPYDHVPLYFVLFADYGADDNNVTVTSGTFHTLLRVLDQYQGVGIHPSLSSNTRSLILQTEFESLSNVIHRKVTISRQHFLSLAMPQTYRSLIQLGITDDYSMGYASNPGFRAGITIPFRFFDLASNETTPLVVHPVSVMDVTLRDYLRLSTEESLDTIIGVIKTIRSVNGDCVSLWHNESLGETGRWKGWRRVYEEMVKAAST